MCQKASSSSRTGSQQTCMPDIAALAAACRRASCMLGCKEQAVQVALQATAGRQVALRRDYGARSLTQDGGELCAFEDAHSPGCRVQVC